MCVHKRQGKEMDGVKKEEKHPLDIHMWRQIVELSSPCTTHENTHIHARAFLWDSQPAMHLLHDSLRSLFQELKIHFTQQ